MVLVTARSTRSSRLPECRLYRAEDLNSTLPDSPARMRSSTPPRTCRRRAASRSMPSRTAAVATRAITPASHGRGPPGSRPPTRLPATAPRSPARTASDQLRRTRLRSSVRPAAPRATPMTREVASTQNVPVTGRKAAARAARTPAPVRTRRAGGAVGQADSTGRPWSANWPRTRSISAASGGGVSPQREGDAAARRTWGRRAGGTAGRPPGRRRPEAGDEPRRGRRRCPGRR